MLLVCHFEGLDSERGIEWRCADSLSLREFFVAFKAGGCPGSFLAVEDPLSAAAGGT